MHVFIQYFILNFFFFVSFSSFSQPQYTPLLNATQNKKQFLALGDSYTAGEGVRTEGSWPYLFRNALEEENIVFDYPHVIAKTGWRTDELLDAVKTIPENKFFDLVSLLIGVNNQYQKKPIEQYEAEFETLLKKAISLTHDDPHRVIVLSIPDYAYTPFISENHESISKEIDRYNEINRRISEKFEVFYIDITKTSRLVSNDSNFVTDDNLHPSEKQYRLWVDEVLKIKQVLFNYFDFST